jgi:hypothetical protein
MEFQSGCDSLNCDDDARRVQECAHLQNPGQLADAITTYTDHTGVRRPPIFRAATAPAEPGSPRGLTSCLVKQEGSISDDAPWIASGVGRRGQLELLDDEVAVHGVA